MFETLELLPYHNIYNIKNIGERLLLIPILKKINN